MAKRGNNLQGFTLIEILVVIGLIAILAAVTIIAINPAQNFQDARNSERRSEVTQILNAISQDIVAGASLSGYVDADDGDAFNATNAPCGTYGATDGWAVGDSTVTGDAEWDGETILAPTYLASIPEDPQDSTAGGVSGYRMCAESATRLTLFAPLAEGTTVQVSR
ncbi:type II secretion system protein [Candidatus Dojkabacteria bacterium]|uniref:Type II secretion system protein n=1 Tax=Candidatus Dojkabacteria bacterium TaxID=2099670 RepID=A0A955L7U0_9BACT|nr:type II secretion system protein [Candidatus Dojkabacteria bacterium]